MKKILVVVLVVALVASVFVGCSAQTPAASSSVASEAASSAAPASSAVDTSTTASDSSGTASAAVSGAYTWPQVGETANVQLVQKDPSKPLKFAFIGYSNNTYWNLIYQGVDQATKYLAQHNVTIEKVDLGSAIGAEIMNNALEAAVASKYDGIVCTPFVTGVENYIKAAVDAGIPVVTIGGESADTAKTGRLCCICADNQPVGELVGKTMAEALKDKPGAKFAVITSLFTMENIEIKRNTATKYLEDKGYKCVGAYEASDSADKTYNLTNDIINANPDIAAIYCIAGGSEGAPKAIEDAKMTGKIFVIGPDETEEHLAYVRTGEMTVVGQNPVGYAFDSFMYLYNKVVGNQTPKTTYDTGIVAAYSQIIDKDNVNQLFPAVASSNAAVSPTTSK